MKFKAGDTVRLDGDFEEYTIHTSFHLDKSKEIEYYIGNGKEDKWVPESALRTFPAYRTNYMYSLPKDGTYNISIPTIDLSKLSKCSHDWKTYQGLNERFEYCTKCDEKNRNL